MQTLLRRPPRQILEHPGNIVSGVHPILLHKSAANLIRHPLQLAEFDWDCGGSGFDQLAM